MMETREITVTIHREPEKRDDLLATLLIVVLAALAFTAGYIAANAQWRETISEVTPEHVVGVVKCQTDADLVYSCRLASGGSYACCTQNLNVCGGLRGSLCKHLLVLLVGLVQGGDLDAQTAERWVISAQKKKPVLDKDVMSETLIRYKGAQAGEIDWRPTETIPEDFYAF